MIFNFPFMSSCLQWKVTEIREGNTYHQKREGALVSKDLEVVIVMTRTIIAFLLISLCYVYVLSYLFVSSLSSIYHLSVWIGHNSEFPKFIVTRNDRTRNLMQRGGLVSGSNP